MSDKKQSSVEYLGWELNTRLFYNISPELWEEVNKIFEQAKAMHNEEMIESYCQGCLDISNDDTIFPRETSEQYYKETFGK